MNFGRAQVTIRPPTGFGSAKCDNGSGLAKCGLWLDRGQLLAGLQLASTEFQLASLVALAALATQVSDFLVDVGRNSIGNQLWSGHRQCPATSESVASWIMANVGDAKNENSGYEFVAHESHKYPLRIISKSYIFKF